MANIHLDTIAKGYGETAVLKGVSIDIRDGEFLTLIGPSGCGKSTLLRIIAGLETQDSGSIAVDGDIIDGKRPKERDVAMVFQSYALYPHYTIYDNIALPLRTRRLSNAQRFPLLGSLVPGRQTIEVGIRQEVGNVAEMLGISHLLDRKPGQLSGGQRQRVALGRAMVRHPKIFLMDEPLSNLDAKLRVQMRAEIVDLHRRLGVTFVYVTHDQAEAMTMSDRVAVMIGGDVLQIAPAEELYRNPDDIRVAEMIGSPKINVVARKHWRIGAPQFALPDSQIAFRPESATIAAPSGGMLEGNVAGIENLGADIFVKVELGDAGPMVVRRAPGERRLEIGESVSVITDAAHMLVFDAAGKRVRPVERIAA